MLCVKNGVHTERKRSLNRTRQWRRLGAFKRTYQGKRHKMFRSLARQEETELRPFSQQNSRLALEASVALRDPNYTSENAKSFWPTFDQNFRHF